MVIRLIGGNQQVIHDIFYLLKKDLCSHSTKNLNDGHFPCLVHKRNLRLKSRHEVIW